jgi:hypothetical protein
MNKSWYKGWYRKGTGNRKGLDTGKGWIQERAGYGKGLDTGKGWIQERAGYRKGLDTGKCWKEGTRYRKGLVQEGARYRKGLDTGKKKARYRGRAGHSGQGLFWYNDKTTVDLAELGTSDKRSNYRLSIITEN